MHSIYFDMDGTLANLYAVDNWLPKLIASDPSPYAEALTMVNMNTLARLLNKLQKAGYHVGIVSWLSKGGTPQYNEEVTRTKLRWLSIHLRSVRFDEIKIVPHGTPKSTVCAHADGILFDDEENNRTQWKGTAYDEKNILEILKNLAKNA